MVAVIKPGTGISFLNSLVTDSVGIVLTLNPILLTVFVSDNINTLIADALCDRYLVETTVSQKFRTSVFKLKSVHGLPPFREKRTYFRITGGYQISGRISRGIK